LANRVIENGGKEKKKAILALRRVVFREEEIDKQEAVFGTGSLRETHTEKVSSTC
jgi:hypothetical protein